MIGVADLHGTAALEPEPVLLGSSRSCGDQRRRMLTHEHQVRFTRRTGGTGDRERAPGSLHVPHRTAQ